MDSIIAIVKKLLLGQFLFFGMVYGQDLPKVIQPSPSASALFRFQDYPMDYSTGLPQINIPIYEIKSGSLSVPISISNHASGRRVSDQNGPIALGWSLNAGGMISRTGYGSVDFGTLGSNHPFPYPFNVNNISLPNDLAYLERITHFDKNPDLSPPGFWKDSEYDIFSYSFNGHSGKFIFKDSNGTKIPLLLPLKPYKIIPHGTSELWSIDITDDAGITYVFMGTDTYSAVSLAVTSGFSLKYIISADKKDTISFFYTAFYEERRSVSQQYIFNDRNDMQPQPGASLTELEFQQSLNPDIYQVSRLTEIHFRNGKVLFNLVSGTNKYENIEVKNQTNETIKTITFNRSFLELMSEVNQSLDKLNGLTFKDRMGTAVESYSFTYYPTLFVGGATQINVRHQDWWGYYNASGVHEMVPYYTNLEYQFWGSSPTYYDRSIGNTNYNREPNIEALKSGVLKKITYPTGGSSEFIYENNKYLSTLNSQVKLGPGLRVSQVKTDDNNGNVSYKTYKYGLTESGSGAIDLEPQLSTMSTLYIYKFLPTMGSGIIGDYRQRIFYSGFNPELSAIAERPIIYTEVAEYNGTDVNNLGKTIYKYDNYAWAPASMPSLSSVHPKMHIYDFNYWNTPSLVSKTDYKRVESGGTVSYQKRKELLNSYSIATTEYVKGLHAQKNHLYTQTDRVTGGWGKYPEEEAVLGGNLAIYSISEYRIPAGFKNLTSSEETLYNEDNSTLTTSVLYEYNSSQLLSKTTTTGSDGIPVSSQIKYPADLTSDPFYGSISTNMVTRNMVNAPIEQGQFKNTSHLKTVRTKYKDWGSDVIAPEYVETKTLNNPSEIRMRYHFYDDHANVGSVSKENDVNQSYLWGYNKAYPIAQAINAKSNEILYRNFEEGSGWDSYLTAYDNSKSHTGRYSGKIEKLTAGEQMSVSSNYLNVSLSTATKYKFSGWVYSDNPNVEIFLFMKLPGETGHFSYFDNIHTTITGKWVYIEKETLVDPNVTQLGIRLDNNGGGTVWFDDIRLHPATAQMTTYSYDPLIGMTSQTDINNKSTYYAYDAFGRLSLIKDHDGNVLKKYCYTYNGQSETCNIFFSNDYSGSYYSQNCSPGTANPYPVSVPAGMFSSSASQTVANTMAQQYAQQQANIHGTCSTPYITVNYYNGIGYDYGVTLYNIVTGQSYYFPIPSYGSGGLGQVPEGTYNISVYSYYDSNYRSFTAGCSYSSGYGSIPFYSVPLNSSCNSIEIY